MYELREHLVTITDCADIVPTYVTTRDGGWGGADYKGKTWKDAEQSSLRERLSSCRSRIITPRRTPYSCASSYARSSFRIPCALGNEYGLATSISRCGASARSPETTAPPSMGCEYYGDLRAIPIRLLDDAPHPPRRGNRDARGRAAAYRAGAAQGPVRRSGRRHARATRLTSVARFSTPTSSHAARRKSLSWHEFLRNIVRLDGPRALAAGVLLLDLPSAASELRLPVRTSSGQNATRTASAISHPSPRSSEYRPSSLLPRLRPSILLAAEDYGTILALPGQASADNAESGQGGRDRSERRAGRGYRCTSGSGDAVVSPHRSRSLSTIAFPPSPSSSIWPIYPRREELWTGPGSQCRKRSHGAGVHGRGCRSTCRSRRVPLRLAVLQRILNSIFIPSRRRSTTSIPAHTIDPSVSPVSPAAPAGRSPCSAPRQNAGVWSRGARAESGCIADEARRRTSTCPATSLQKRSKSESPPRRMHSPCGRPNTRRRRR
ncbi:hypothetical protein C8R47DRAFT_804191 [Mycena vitilis]|nr:hypothetical protein C8R47DRAFT_804191 [Mycena vitilis]